MRKRQKREGRKRRKRNRRRGPRSGAGAFSDQWYLDVANRYFKVLDAAPVGRSPLPSCHRCTHGCDGFGLFCPYCTAVRDAVAQVEREASRVSGAHGSAPPSQARAAAAPPVATPPAGGTDECDVVASDAPRPARVRPRRGSASSVSRAAAVSVAHAADSTRNGGCAGLTASFGAACCSSEGGCIGHSDVPRADGHEQHADDHAAVDDAAVHREHVHDDTNDSGADAHVGAVGGSRTVHHANVPERHHDAHAVVDAGVHHEHTHDDEDHDSGAGAHVDDDADAHLARRAARVHAQHHDDRVEIWHPVKRRACWLLYLDAHWKSKDVDATLLAKLDAEDVGCERNDSSWRAEGDAIPSAFTGEACYARRYPDVLADFCAGGVNTCKWSAIRDHWREHGKSEGRQFGCES